MFSLRKGVYQSSSTVHVSTHNTILQCCESHTSCSAVNLIFLAML